MIVHFFIVFFFIQSQGTKVIPPVITCSKLAIETPEQRCEICSKLTIKPPKRRHWHRFGGFIVNFEHISHLFSSVSIVNFEQVNAGWNGWKTIENIKLSRRQVVLHHIYVKKLIMNTAQLLVPLYWSTLLT